ncbi:MAG TPA: hypothetical protein VN648_24680, partial [Candidatus Methylomirabilis sp.]|nr:hypothetical protein [Candidatus Methylomirabilis sp.]
MALIEGLWNWDGTGKPRAWPKASLLVGAILLLTAAAAWAQAGGAEPSPAYRSFPTIGSKLAVWGAAQLHLDFAAFILGVPIFAVIVEFVGWRT